MATYVNDLRLKEIATGDEAGTWGTSTNTNLELIGEALGYGTQDCFASDADATTTVADGATDPARAMYFKVTSSATLTATRTLTIAPNTMTRVMLIENATTGSQSIAISQGSGGNVTIASGQVKMVYLDGAGAGAAVVDALADLELGTITVANLTATTSDINGGNIDGTVIGAATPAAGSFTTGSFSGNVSFADNAKAIFGAGSDLQIYHDGINSYIDDAGTGGLFIRSNEFLIQKYTGEAVIYAVADGAVNLYYDNAAKLATTSTGIDVTGTVTADGLTVDGGGSNVTVSFAPSSTFSTTVDFTNASSAFQIVSFGSGSASADNFRIRDAGASRLNIAGNGDISFYEDTGTTAKFFWDASAEDLTLTDSTAGGTFTDAEGVRGSTNGLNTQLQLYKAGGNDAGISIAAGSTGSAAVGLYANKSGTNQADFIIRQDDGSGTSKETLT